MKMILVAVLMVLGLSARAQSPVFEVGYSTFVVVGVTVTSGTAVQINSRPSGFAANVGKYRLVNAHPSWDIYIGDVNVSTNIFSANLGEKVPASTGNTEWPVGKDYRRNAALVPIYAKAADSATVDRLPRLSVIWFGW